MRARRRVVRCPRCHHPVSTATPGPCVPCMAEITFRLDQYKTRPHRRALAAATTAGQAFGGTLKGATFSS